VEQTWILFPELGLLGSSVTKKQMTAEIKPLQYSWNKVLMQDNNLCVCIRLTGSQGMLTMQKNILQCYK